MIQISKGTRKRAQRTVLYGPEGCGKSTLGSTFPGVLFIDAEGGGTDHLDVARVRPKSFADIQGVVAAFAKGAPEVAGFKTLVLDTIDWIERLLAESICEKHGKSGIEDFGYGKGMVFLEEGMAEFLLSLDPIVDRGVNVLVLAHSQVKTFTPPDAANGYDRYELKLSKRTAPVVKEWADVLLFANHVVKMQDRDGGKARAVGGNERVLHTQHSPSWDAKNRLSLRPELRYTTPESGRKVLAPVIYLNEPEPGRDWIKEAIALIPEELHAAAVEFMVAGGHLKEGAKLSEMPEDYARKIVAAPQRFLGAIKGKPEGSEQ